MLTAGGAIGSSVLIPRKLFSLRIAGIRWMLLASLAQVNEYLVSDSSMEDRKRNRGRHPSALLVSPWQLNHEKASLK